MGAASCTQRCSGKNRESIRNLEEVQSDLLNSKSGPNDTVTKLTGQLELLETQMRQVQEENDKLTRLKESLEHTTGAKARLNDQLKEELQSLELQLSSKEKEYSAQISSLEAAVRDLNDKLQSTNSAVQIENEKWSRQKESLERAVDATARERDQLKEKLQSLELQLSSKVNEYSAQISSLEAAVQDLNGKLQFTESAAQADNENWSREKETLERAAAATANERDQFKEKLKGLELQLSNKENEYSAQIKSLTATVEDLNGKLQSANTIAQVDNEKFAREKGYLEHVAAAASSERDQLEKKLHNLSSARDQLEKKLQNVSSGKDQLEKKLQNLSSEREQLVKKLHNLELQLSKKEDTSKNNALEKAVHEKLQTILTRAQEQPKPQSAKTADNNNRPVVKKVYICSFCKRFETEGVPELKQHMTYCAHSRGEISRHYKL